MFFGGFIFTIDSTHAGGIRPGRLPEVLAYPLIAAVSQERYPLLANRPLLPPSSNGFRLPRPDGGVYDSSIMDLGFAFETGTSSGFHLAENAFSTAAVPEVVFRYLPFRIKSGQGGLSPQIEFELPMPGMRRAKGLSALIGPRLRISNGAVLGFAYESPISPGRSPVSKTLVELEIKW